jgi:hypothetical protein
MYLFGPQEPWSEASGAFAPACRERDGVCSELAAYAAETHDNDRRGGGDSGESYRAIEKFSWWPSGLGSPTSVGAQNDLRRCALSSFGY